MDTRKWYILYTKPQFERTVYQGLLRKGFETFLPSRIEERQWSDRKKKIDIPLFPGYVFVYLSHQQLYMALSVRGAVKFVSFANEIATVRKEEIERIQVILSSDLVLEVTEAIQELEEGDHVMLEEGPLTGQTVEFIEYKGKKRGIFKLEAIGKCLLINLPLNALLEYQH